MENIKKQYTLSLYEEIANFNENRKSKVFLVKNIQNNKIYIKKILTQYDIKIFKTIKEMNSLYIPNIYEIIEDDKKLIIIEEFINGLTLREILDKDKKIDEELVIDYMLQLCDVLEKIHNCNPPIIHRDIKPENIIISNDWVLKLIDFDVSRTYKENENRDTELLGTLEYAAPEQFGFMQTDARTDIYSIGVLINVLITGKVPRIERCIGRFQYIVEKCIKIDPNERYQNIDILKKDIESIKILKNNVEKEDKNIHHADKEKKIFLDVIPGFRTRTNWKMICAAFFYLFLICGLMTYENKFTLDEFRTNITVVIILLSLWFLYTNFFEIRDRLPIINSNNIIVKIFGYILYSLAIIVILGEVGGL